MANLLAVLAEGKTKASHTNWIQRLVDLGSAYEQEGCDPAPLVKEAREIMAWAYEFAAPNIDLMPDWLMRAFRIYESEALEQSNGLPEAQQKTPIELEFEQPCLEF